MKSTRSNQSTITIRNRKYRNSVWGLALGSHLGIGIAGRTSISSNLRSYKHSARCLAMSSTQDSSQELSQGGATFEKA